MKVNDERYRLAEWRDGFFCLSVYCFAMGCIGALAVGLLSLPLSLAGAHLGRIVSGMPIYVPRHRGGR